MSHVFSPKRLALTGISAGFVTFSTIWHNAIYSLFTVEQFTVLIVASIIASAAFLITLAVSAALTIKRFIAGRILL